MQTPTPVGLHAIRLMFHILLHKSCYIHFYYSSGAKSEY